MRLKGISLRSQLMAALMVIPLAGLSLFLGIATSAFEKDKIAYVFDSSLSVSKMRAARVSSEIAANVSIAQAVVLSYRSDTKNLSESGTYYFDRESKFEAFQLYAWNPGSSTYERNVDLAKPNGKRAIEGKGDLLNELVQAARLRPVAVRGVEKASDRMAMAVRFGEVSDPRHVIALVVFDATELAEIFSDGGRFVSFLSHKDDGKAVFMEPSAPDWAPESVWRELADKKTPEGTEEIVMGDGAKFLASFSEVGVGDLVVVSMNNRAAALAVIRVLLTKSFFFLVGFIGLTLIFATIAARRMTSGYERLAEQTAEATRVEAELATARVVQETLFPESHARFDAVEIAGHYNPAGECRGDWWFYFEKENKIYVWIGSAKGHGVQAALSTSAVRAVASLITTGPALSVGDYLSILNRGLFDTGKGGMNMSMFIACIDQESGVMNYSNASHEAPALLRKKATGEPTRDDFMPLLDADNPRLGEDPNRTFQESSIELGAGDAIVLYTDGILNLKNREDKPWGENRFLSTVAVSLGAHEATQEAVAGVVLSWNDYRSQAELRDDVTLVICRFMGRAQPMVGAA